MGGYMNIPHSSIRCARKIGLKVKQIITLLLAFCLSRSSPSQTLSLSVTQFITAFTQECKSYVELCLWHTKTVTRVHKIDQEVCSSFTAKWTLTLQMVKDGNFYDVMMSYLDSKVSVAYLPPSSCTICLISWCLNMGTTSWKNLSCWMCEEVNTGHKCRWCHQNIAHYP